MTLQEIQRICAQVAKQFGVTYYTKDFSDYGWTQIAIETDHFGGGCIGLCYKHDTGKCFDAIHTAREVEITSARQLALYAHDKVQNMIQARFGDDSLAQFINSQY